MPKRKDYELKGAAHTILNPDEVKARRFDEMRTLVLELAELQEEKKVSTKHYNESIDETYAKLHALASQDDNQFQMNLAIPAVGTPEQGSEETDGS